MEDLSSQPNTYRRPRTYRRSPVIFNPAADVLAGIEYVEGAFKERRAKVNLFQAQAEQRRIDMQKAVDDTKRIDETDAMAEMTAQFSNMVTDLYKADIASFDGDRSDYLKMYNNAQSVIGNFGKVIGVVDELSNKYTSMNPAEQKKMVLRSQFVGDDAETKKAYVDFLNDPSKMNIRIQGKDIIITNNGKDLFNGTQLLNSVKAGSNLIEYAGDYTKEIESASKEAMSGVKNLVVAKQYETMSDDGSTLYTTAKKDYIDAVNAYIDNLESSDKIQALINESTFQRFTDNSDVYDEIKHGKLTKQKMIDFLVNKEFPMYDAEKGTAIGDKKITSKLTTTNKGDGKDGKKKNFNNWIKENLRGKKKQQTTVNQGDIAKGQGGTYQTKTEEVDLTPEDQKQIFYEKLVTENPRYVFGSQIDMTGENANKVYQRIGNTIRPFSITDEQIKNDEYLNNLLVSESVL